MLEESIKELDQEEEEKRKAAEANAAAAAAAAAQGTEPEAEIMDVWPSVFVFFKVRFLLLFAHVIPILFFSFMPCRERRKARRRDPLRNQRLIRTIKGRIISLACLRPGMIYLLKYIPQWKSTRRSVSFSFFRSISVFKL